jgi:hypothetical protein
MMRALIGSFAALVTALTLTAPAIAQEQRASIEGTVRDSSGGVPSTGDSHRM